MFKLRIKNWAKYNARTDIKTPHWFRMDRDFFLDPVVFELTPAQKLFNVYLYCLACRAGSDTVVVNLRQVSVTLGGVPADELLEAVVILEQHGKIEVVQKPAIIDVTQTAVSDRIRTLPAGSDQVRTDPFATRQDKTRQDSSGSNEPLVDEPASAGPTTLALGPSPSDQDQDRGVATKLAQIWNANCGPVLGQVRLPLTAKSRITKARVRWNEQRDEAYWAAVVQRVAASKFCCGDGGKGWRATFDWLIANDRNHMKVMEGTYDNRGGAARGAQDIGHLFEGLEDNQ